MRTRATAMSADDRRRALVDVTLPLLLEHGRTVTTRQIAEAAGVAEGTIFRVFESKDDLVQATLDRAFDIEPFLEDLRRIDPDQPLRALVTEMVTLLQSRFRGIFTLMTAVGMVGPPKGRSHEHHPREEAARVMADLLAPHADEVRVPVAQLVHVTRLLTFSGSHPHLSDGRILTAEEIVSTVLDGLLTKGD
ncbi:TetR/AcrR family transcriptional regulator [Nocardioides sp. Soil777]|uniref:TetR/AcrR family transcriptional regulator n=1 Tax=Nocardioides sp. Soil777 TaxID=1736409 RepID=UPI000AD0EC06|nr:TetR/AcrR family transcriptional regulator [Nocardioides sp. Soil777]